MVIKRDSTISIIRVLAMISIIAGHVFAWENINTYQLLSIGVEIFLFVSGYLYAHKDIDSILAFLKERITKLLIPCWIMMCVIGIVTWCIEGELESGTVLVYLLNLQGIPFVFRGIKKWPVISGGGQLWFLTVIFACYIIMYWAKKYRADSWVDKHLLQTFIASGFVVIIVTPLNIVLSYFWIYFLGYFWARTDKKLSMKRKAFCILTGATLALGVGRFVCRTILDGTPFYEVIVARVSMCLLAVWIIVCVANITSLAPNTCDKIANSKGWIIMDRLSYPLFVTHYAFLVGPFDVSQWFGKSFLGLFVFIIATCLSALSLDAITRCIMYKGK